MEAKKEAKDLSTVIVFLADDTLYSLVDTLEYEHFIEKKNPFSVRMCIHYRNHLTYNNTDTLVRSGVPFNKKKKAFYLVTSVLVQLTI